MRVFSVRVAMCWGGICAAQDHIPWKTLANWQISVDTTIQNGCYAVTGWDSGTALRIGLNPAKDSFYLLVGNKTWTQFAPNTPYDIRIKFDSKAAWDITATRLKVYANDATYLHAEGSSYAFLEEFMVQREMKITHNNAPLDRLPLRGSARALQEVIACQKEVDAKGVPTPEPLARAEGRSDVVSAGEGEAMALNHD